MTLRIKTLLVIGAALGGLVLAVYGLASHLLLRSVLQIEAQDSWKNVQRAQSAVEQTLSELSAKLTDWAQWDDTYAFMQDANEEFIRSNVVPGAFQGNRLSLMVFARTDGHVVLGRGFDLTRGEVTPVPAEFSEYLSAASPLLAHDSPDSVRSGLVLLPHSTLLLASRPIVTSEGKGPIRGALIFGRLLDQEEIRRLAVLTHLDLDVYRRADGRHPDDPWLAASARPHAGSFMLKPVNEHLLVGYAALADIRGEPALSLRVTLSRDVYQQGLNSLHYFLIMLVTTGLVLIGVTLGLLERVMLTRLVRLGADVQRIGAGHDPSVRVGASGSDELADLARAINGMLGALDASQRQVRASEERLQRVLEGSNDSFWDWQISTEAIEFSPRWGEMLGYGPREIAPHVRAWEKLIHPEDRPRVKHALNDHLQGRSLFYEAEYRLRTRSGDWKWVLDRGKVVTRDAQGRPLRAAGTHTDIGERKRAAEALRQSEARFRSVFDNAAVGVAVLDRHGCILDINEAGCGFLAYSRDELTGRNVATLTHPDDQTADEQLFRALLCGERDSYAHEKRYLRKDGRILWGRLHVSMVRSIDGEPEHAVVVCEDITERKDADARIQYMAHHDALTMLPNRVLLFARLEQALASARRHSRHVAILFFDLDRFKEVNDSLGHHVGDRLLQAVGTRLEASVRASDTVARVGGDEFVVVLPDLRTPDEAVVVVEHLFAHLSAPYTVVEHELYLTVSLGISVYPQDGADIDTLLNNADAALYGAKAAGRSNFQFYRRDMNARASEVLSIEKELRRALSQEEFVLHYQPQVDIASGRTIGAEALIRWQHPERGLISPGRFIPIAEERGLIVPIGDWVLRTACAQSRRWQEAGLPVVPIAVNLSALQFRHHDFLGKLTDVLLETGADPRCLELELTESIIMHGAEATIVLLSKLKAMGLRLSIDDFGTGYSSLNYLRRFAIDKLKIDQSFVREMADDPNAAAITRVVIDLAKTLKLKVLAEGVETREQLELLRTQGCDEAQGYYLGRPVPVEEFEPILSRECPPPIRPPEKLSRYRQA